MNELPFYRCWSIRQAGIPQRGFVSLRRLWLNLYKAESNAKARATMLTDVEKMLFILLAMLSIGAAAAGFREMWQIIQRGTGTLHLERIIPRALQALAIYLSQRTTLKTRPLTSVIHWGVVLGFTYYFLINFVDLLQGFVPGFAAQLARLGGLYDAYRLLADALSVVVLAGIVYFLLRRFALPNRQDLRFHDNILLHPKAAAGAITQDSLIVAFFILLHVGARFLGESVAVAQHGADVYMPFASALAGIWGGLNADAMLFAAACLLVAGAGRRAGVLALLPTEQARPLVHGAVELSDASAAALPGRVDGAGLRRRIARTIRRGGAWKICR